MTKTVSQIIYKAFFENLSKLDTVNPKTVEKLQKLFAENQITDRKQLSRTALEMEARYAENQNPQSA
ncbi:MAG: hypothetical protein WC901_08295 [Candidatus Margulisiibacteriota bacterium]